MPRPISYCSVLGCVRRCWGLGLCQLHYTRMRKHGSTDPFICPSKPSRYCRVCGKKAVVRSMCRVHYRHLFMNAEGRPACAVDGCIRPLYAKKMCELHYNRLKDNGSLELPYRRTETEAFWMKVARCGPNECWEWQAAKVLGYGRFRQYSAHRFAYELLVGPIPTGTHLNHICCNPGCVNPAHLQPIEPSAHVYQTWINTLKAKGLI